jgi:magnesium chelatase family protein
MQDSHPDDQPSITSEQMHQEVIHAFMRQMKRGQKHLNGKLDEKEIETFCRLEPEAETLLSRAIQRFGLSHRSVANVKKVARTIADLDAKERIQKEHLLEALSFRRREGA